MNENDKFALAKAYQLCEEGGHVLLYLSRHGSHLYGTSTANSDYDYKGIFLPNINDLIMGSSPVKGLKTLDYQSKDDPAKKNEAGDIDFQLFSIQFWLNKLVKKGETEGIELLYSHTNKEAVIFCDLIMTHLFTHKKDLFDPRKTESFLGFAIGQARTYFTKAERFSVIESIYNYSKDRFDKLQDRIEEVVPLLSDIMDDIVEKFYHPSYCFAVDSNNLLSIQICGKVHQSTISLDEFIHRVYRDLSKYGHRTRKAAEMDAKDWKSLSHALKAIIEVRTLLETGQISFPLPERSLLASIKRGEVEFSQVESMILSGIDLVTTLKESFSDDSWGYNKKFVLKFLTSLYSSKK
jgi:hypothetical protein